VNRAVVEFTPKFLMPLQRVVDLDQYATVDTRKTPVLPGLHSQTDEKVVVAEQVAGNAVAAGCCYRDSRCDVRTAAETPLAPSGQPGILQIDRVVDFCRDAL